MRPLTEEDLSFSSVPVFFQYRDGRLEGTLQIPRALLQDADYFAASLSGRCGDVRDAAMPLGDKLTEEGVVDVMLFLCNSEAVFFSCDVKPLKVSDFILVAD